MRYYIERLMESLFTSALGIGAWAVVEYVAL